MVDGLETLTLPWTHRRDIGRLRALWRTFWTVSWHTRRACGVLAQPVDFPEALRFRRTVVWFVWVALVLVAVMGAAVDGGETMHVLHGPDGLFYLTGAFIVVVALWPLLYFCTGVHTYWFHPRRLSVDQQNRAVALSYYACAPLLLFVPAVLALAAAFGLNKLYQVGPALTVIVTGWVLAAIGGLLVVVSVVAFWWVCLALVRRAAQRETAGTVVMAVVMPVCWVVLSVLSVLCLVVPLFLAGLVWTVVQTL